MTLEQLRIFLEVAARQHVTRAADVLNLTQSAVSASIAALEARHAIKLFDRVGRRIELTEVGQKFIPQAEAVLAQARTAELFLADMGGQAVGTARIHASQTVANYWLPQRLVSFRRSFPRIGLELSVSNTTRVAQAVAEGAADIGVVEAPVMLPDLEKRIVASDRIVLVVGSGHHWAGRSRIGIEELPRSSWILREVGSGTRSEFEAALGRSGMHIEDLDVSLELPSNEAVLAALLAGLDASVLSERAVRPSVASGALVAIEMDFPARDFAVLTHSLRHRTRAVEALIEVLAGSG